MRKRIKSYNILALFNLGGKPPLACSESENEFVASSHAATDVANSASLTLCPGGHDLRRQSALSRILTLLGVEFPWSRQSVWVSI